MIRKDVTRLDAFEKATGRAVYTTDMRYRYPDALCVKALRSPYAHAEIQSIDTEKAKALPGVVSVITASDMNIDWELIPAQSRLAGKRAIWAGQVVALVCAKTGELAEQAVSMIHVAYEALPHVLTCQEAFQKEPIAVVEPERAPEICKHADEMKGYPNVAKTFYLQKGTVDIAMEEADAVVEGEFFTGKKTHNQLERAAVLVECRPDGGYTLYCNGCGVHSEIKKPFCKVFSIPENQLRIVQPYIGGSFGNRNVPYVEALAMMVAIRVKRTVYYEFTRDEMFCGAPSAWTCASKMRMGATKDGRIIARDLHMLEEVGANTGDTSYTGRLSSSAIAVVYRIPNTRMRTASVLTNTVPAAPYRGLGSPDVTFANELMIEELAEKLGMSSLQLRLNNILENGELDDYGSPIKSIGLRECLLSVANAIEYEVSCEDGGGVWKRGKGIACAGKQNSPRSRSEAEVRVYSDGSVELLVSCDNHGMGATTALAQIAAEELQIEASEVFVTCADTAITPFDNNSSSSSGVYRTGNAVRLAAQDAVQKLRQEAARRAGTVPDMVEIRDGMAYIKGAAVEMTPIRSLFDGLNPFKDDLYGLKQGSPVVGRGMFCPAPIVPWDENGQTPRMWNWVQYSATGVEIAVNIETGQIKVLKIATACDSGNPINPKIVESQMDGGVHMAIGFCVTEETLYDKNGKIWNATFSDYRLPMIYEMPKNDDVHTFICPNPLPDGPYGAKGMSESIVSATAPAIAAALYRAAGIRVHNYPMTAEKILAALHEKEV
jgi:carbon-monoxide dehydrogenase large subunit